MKRFTAIVLVNLLTLFIVSCKGAENGDSESGDSGSDSKVEKCKDDVKKWDVFLGIPYGANELELEDYLGKFTGGEYTDDSSSFVYYFKRVNRAPISIWVNAKTGKIETIFMEILGLNEYFDEDVADVQDEFDLSDCDVKWFGMEADEVIDILGKPNRDKMKEDKEGKDVRSIFYDSDDLEITLNFKFYESQDNICSSVAVYWFY